MKAQLSAAIKARTSDACLPNCLLSPTINGVGCSLRIALGGCWTINLVRCVYVWGTTPVWGPSTKKGKIITYLVLIIILFDKSMKSCHLILQLGRAIGVCV